METKVLTVDTGNAITNVKEFKERIEELKGALLGLEKGTEEYNAVAQELRQSQEKLTEVMDVARGKTEGVEGSYDNLVATMRELKKAWRATTDEAERATLGAQILEINNQLKELDASTGNFQRNVGDYANAFEEAFKNVLDGIGSGNSALAQSSRSVVKLIPLIKQATKAATTGLDGIKKAIVSTGVGALVVAVGLLATNWDKVKNVLSGMIGKQKDLTDEMNNSVNSAEALKRKYDEINNSLDFALRLMQAQGATNAEVLKFQEESLINQYTKANELLAQRERELKTLQEMRGVSKEEKKAKEEQIQAQRDIVAEYSKQLDINRQNQQIEEARAKKAEEERIKADEERRKTGGTSVSTKTPDRQDDELKQIDEIQKALDDAGKTELEKLEERYNAQKTLFEKYGKDTTELTKKFQKDYLAILNKNRQERLTFIQDASAREREEMVAETEKTIAEIKQKAKDQTIAVQLDFELKTLEDNKLSGLEKFFGQDTLFNLDNITGPFDAQIETTNKIFEINKTALDAEKTELENLLAALDVNTEEYATTKQRIAEIGIETSNLETENAIANLEATDAREQALADARKRRMASYSDGLSSVAGLIENIGGVLEEQITTEVESGKISEKTAKTRFETVKKMQIGAAIINMAAGVVSAIASAQEAGPYLGPILAAINSAAVIAAGTVQISQIKRQQFGSNGSANNSATTPDLQRAVNMIQIQPVQNVTGQSETTELANAINSKPIVVKVTDIEDTEQIVGATKVESTF